jgi:hypothetical protein
MFILMSLLVHLQPAAQAKQQGNAALRSTMHPRDPQTI